MRTECDRGRFSRAQQRIYHAMFQLIAFALGLALSANNLGILWVAMEGATLATVLVVSLDRSRPALQAAWKVFVRCGVGILQALFGTVLLYMAAERVIGADEGALLWTHLAAIRTQLDPQIVTLAFALLFVGYGTKMGLVPFHGWLPDAHAEGPTPVSAVLSGLLLGVALHAILRCKILADGALQTPVAGQLMIGFGLLSVVLAALLLARQQDLRKLLAWSSIEHMGILSIAFGLGGATATLAGLVHLVGHALVKSGLYFSAAQAVQWSGTGQIAGIRGLLSVRPALAWSLLLGAMAILGLPPFSLFPSELMMLSTLLETLPWVAAALLAALVIAFASIALRVRDRTLGAAAQEQAEKN
jgi:hydrogenase-4 component F